MSSGIRNTTRKLCMNIKPVLRTRFYSFTFNKNLIFVRREEDHGLKLLETYIVFIWEQTAICATYSRNWLVFILYNYSTLHGAKHKILQLLVRIINLSSTSIGCQFSLWTSQVAVFNWACKSGLLVPWALLRGVGVVWPLRAAESKGLKIGLWNVNIFNSKKKYFQGSTIFKILRKITGNSINNFEVCSS
jgi:hypothetical protein